MVGLLRRHVMPPADNKIASIHRIKSKEMQRHVTALSERAVVMALDDLTESSSRFCRHSQRPETTRDR